MDEHFCTICQQEGRALPVLIDGEQFFTCLCVAHDVLCLKSIIDKDFSVLAAHLVFAAAESSEAFSDAKSVLIEVGDEQLDLAVWFATCRMSGLGLSPKNVESLGQLINEMDENEDDIDLEMKVLVFAFENGLLGEANG